MMMMMMMVQMAPSRTSWIQQQVLWGPSSDHTNTSAATAQSASQSSAPGAKQQTVTPAVDLSVQQSSEKDAVWRQFRNKKRWLLVHCVVCSGSDLAATALVLCNSNGQFDSLYWLEFMRVPHRRAFWVSESFTQSVRQSKCLLSTNAQINWVSCSWLFSPIPTATRPPSLFMVPADYPSTLGVCSRFLPFNSHLCVRWSHRVNRSELTVSMWIHANEEEFNCFFWTLFFLITAALSYKMVTSHMYFAILISTNFCA